MLSGGATVGGSRPPPSGPARSCLRVRFTGSGQRPIPGIGARGLRRWGATDTWVGYGFQEKRTPHETGEIPVALVSVTDRWGGQGLLGGGEGVLKGEPDRVVEGRAPLVVQRWGRGPGPSNPLGLRAGGRVDSDPHLPSVLRQMAARLAPQGQGWCPCDHRLEPRARSQASPPGTPQTSSAVSGARAAAKHLTPDPRRAVRVFGRTSSVEFLPPEFRGV